MSASPEIEAATGRVPVGDSQGGEEIEMEGLGVLVTPDCFASVAQFLTVEDDYF